MRPCLVKPKIRGKEKKRKEMGGRREGGRDRKIEIDRDKQRETNFQKFRKKYWVDFPELTV